MPEDLPFSKTLPEAEREKIRQKYVDEIPAWYSPHLHLFFPSFFGFLIILCCAYYLHQVTWWEWLMIPVTYFIANGFEWHAHKNLLHKRSKLAPVLYDRHTPIHHMVYITEDMAIRSFKEARLVLIPAYGILLVFLTTLPLGLVAYYLVSHNSGYLLIATSMAYVIGYEALHYTYHLPDSHPIWKISILKKLQRHHAIHHNPQVMQNWNLNVTVPIWDFILGTIWKPAQK